MKRVLMSEAFTGLIAVGDDVHGAPEVDPQRHDP